MIESESIQEFNIFGHKVRFKPDSSESFTAQEVIDLLENTGREIGEGHNLSETKKLLLTALKIASQKVKLEKVLSTNVTKLESEVDMAIELLNQFEEAPQTLS